MPQYQVTQQPQAIFINGDPAQQPMTIKNEGPFTVWADSDSSVHHERSIPIPPKGTLGWDAGRALWMVGKRIPENGFGDVVDSSSLVNITRNSQVPNYSFDIVETIYRDAAQFIEFGDPWKTPYAIEVSSYQSLILTVINDTWYVAGEEAASKVYGVGITWLDSKGNQCGFEQFNMIPQCEDGPTFLGTVGAAAVSPDGFNSAKAYVTIKGHYAIVELNNTDGVGSIPDVSIVGTTRALSDRVVFNHMDALPHCCDANSPFGPTYFNIGNDCVQFDWGNFAAGGTGMNYTQLLLPQIGNRVRLVFTTSVATTNTGSLRISDPFNTGMRYDESFVIPVVGLAQVITHEFVRPKGTCLQLTWASRPKQGGGATDLQVLNTTIEYLD